MGNKPNSCLVLDVGKTNVKIHVLDERLKSLASFVRANEAICSDPYPHADVDGIWQWMMETFQKCAARFDIHAIAVSTHGATAALVDSSASGNSLVLPVMDYEWSGVDSINESYAPLRPAFGETGSPELAAGLNLGRQLMWQQHQYPGEFARADALLMYPQYWTWRLCGVPVSEVSSLGCHTDLWAPGAGEFSSLVTRQGWEQLFPPLAPAWSIAGTVSEPVSSATGLSAACRVHVGVHDSNASLLRFLLAMPGEEFCVVSSGTWVVCMSTANSLENLDSSRDMLVNVDVRGHPVPCVRFMGGREYARICDLTETAIDRETTVENLLQIISAGVMAWPDFSRGSGPFGGREPEIRGAPSNGAALATIYCALMVDYCLDLLQVKGDVIIVGGYLQNPLLCSMIAQLRDPQPVYLSSDEAGTVRGAAQLAAWDNPVPVDVRRSTPTSLGGLQEYRQAWRSTLDNES